MRAKGAREQAREWLGHGSNLMVLAMLVGLLVAMPPGRLLALAPWALLGFALFPGIEYALHRFVLHARPSKHAWFKRMQRRLHYDHHKAPERLELLFLPFWVTLPLAALGGGFYRLLAGSWSVALAILFGSLSGLLWYEWVHYRAHIPNAPKTPWGRWMKKYHLWHHFKHEGYWFGVTSPGVDWLAGTYRAVERVPRSPTVSILFLDPVQNDGQ